MIVLVFQPVIISQYKFSHLNTNLLSNSLWVRSSHWARTQVSAGQSLMEAPEEKSSARLFQLLEATNIPGLRDPFSSLRSQLLISFTSFFMSPWDRSRERFSVLRTHDYLVSTWIIQNNLPISNALILITTATFLLLRKVMYCLVPETRKWTSLGGCYSLYHNGHPFLKN